MRGDEGRAACPGCLSCPVRLGRQADHLDAHGLRGKMAQSGRCLFNGASCRFTHSNHAHAIHMSASTAVCLLRCQARKWSARTCFDGPLGVHASNPAQPQRGCGCGAAEVSDFAQNQPPQHLTNAQCCSNVCLLQRQPITRDFGHAWGRLVRPHHMAHMRGNFCFCLVFASCHGAPAVPARGRLASLPPRSVIPVRSKDRQAKWTGAGAMRNMMAP